MIVNKILKNFCTTVSALKDLYILSAVRTPIGLLHGTLSGFTAPQLGSFAINEALQRGTVPSQDLHNVFLGCFSNNHCHDEIMRRVGLPKTAKVSLAPTSGLTSLLEGVKFLLESNQNVCVAGEMESISNSSVVSSQIDLHKDVKKLLTNNLVDMWDLNKQAQKDYNNFMNAKLDGAFCDEILKINFRKKGHQIKTAEDELFRNELAKGDSFFKWLPALGDGAAALILSTEDYSKKNNLIPLAKIISFGEEQGSPSDLASAQVFAIEKALSAAECKSENIMRWEILSVMNKVVVSCENYFNIDSSRINKDGGIFTLGYPVGMSGVRAVCHLVHSLKPDQLGCAATYDFSGNSSAIIIKKLGESVTEGKPRLTLYTKHQCSLCVELKDQLKPFEGQFLLKEIDIERDENRKYSDLYAFDIPVLFLNGVFLCKHRLNVQHLCRRLAASGASLTYNRISRQASWEISPTINSKK